MFVNPALIDKVSINLYLIVGVTTILCILMYAIAAENTGKSFLLVCKPGLNPPTYFDEHLQYWPTSYGIIMVGWSKGSAA